MSGATFSKAARLLKNTEFRQVYAEGRQKRLSCLTLHWLKVAGDKRTRLGISVGRRLGGAVVRNLVKRRFRELFRTYPQPLPPGYWIVISAKKGCEKRSLEALKKDVYHFINKELTQ